MTDVAAGGATVFPDVGAAVWPKKVIIEYLKSRYYCNSLWRQTFVRLDWSRITHPNNVTLDTACSWVQTITPVHVQLPKVTGCRDNRATDTHRFLPLSVSVCLCFESLCAVCVAGYSSVLVQPVPQWGGRLQHKTCCLSCTSGQQVGWVSLSRSLSVSLCGWITWFTSWLIE